MITRVLALRRWVGQRATFRRLGVLISSGCLLWSAGCCLTIELNHARCRNGCQSCGCGDGCQGGCGAADCQSGCARCQRHGRGGEFAGGPVDEGPGLGRFFPVPTRPVFSQPAAAVEEVPSPQARKVRRPRPIPPEPDDSAVNTLAIRKPTRK